MNFSGRNFLFGLGTGIILLSLVFYVVYSFSLAKQSEAVFEMTDEELFGLARDMGMGFAEDFTTQDLLDGVEQQQIADGLTDTEIILRAEELGMVFPVAQELTNEDDADDETVPEQPETVSISIPAGLNATEIAALLEAKAVIEDAAGFIRYLKEQKADYRISTGTFDLPLQGAFEEVLDIILKKL